MLELNKQSDIEVVELLKALGRAYLENGENHKAADKFRELIRQGFEDEEILLDLTLALARTDSATKDALQIYNKTCDIVENDEALYLTLAPLFLKKEITEEPALKVLRRALKFSPPYSEEIRNALEKVFQETTETITIPEIRETLLDCADSPELITLFIKSACREHKYDETIQILKDLYSRSNRNRVYLDALCETLLSKKTYTEENGIKFNLTRSDALHCLKYNNIHDPISRINQIETYLDFKNLFLGLNLDTKRGNGNEGEYEFILLNKELGKLEDFSDSEDIPIRIEPGFNLAKDFLDKMGSDSRTKAAHVVTSEPKFSALNTIAVLEIKNYDSPDHESKLPFKTFLKLLSGELRKSDEIFLSETQDGLIFLCANPNKMLKTATDILSKVIRYNQIVDASEIIYLKITLHHNTVPFIELENHGIREIRKAFKVHNIDLTNLINSRMEEKENPAKSNTLLITESLSEEVKGFRLNHLGQFQLPHLPQVHNIYEILYADPVTKSPQVEVKETFGKYEVSEILKEDQLCSTYRGYDPQLERPVIIKAYRAQAFAGFKEYAALRKQFYEEVRRLNRINHPNIGVIYDAGEDGEILYLIREYVEGRQLNKNLNQDGLPPIQKTLEVYLKICKILAFYHKTQIWHKNLKPDNILITDQNEIKLLDSGLLQIRHLDDVWNENIDSQAYAAPEQIQGLRLTQSCDIFQLGIMLYESFTGQHPFAAPVASEVRIRILADDPPPASAYRDEITEGLDRILLKSLNKNPVKRYQTINELQTELNKEYQGTQEFTPTMKMMEILK